MNLPLNDAVYATSKTMCLYGCTTYSLQAVHDFIEEFISFRARLYPREQFKGLRIFNYIALFYLLRNNFFLAIFRNEITTIPIPSTSEGGECGRWEWSRFSF